MNESPYERLYEFERDGAHYACDLVDCGAYGCEVRFLRNGTLLYSRRFDCAGTHALAVAWALHERPAFESDLLAPSKNPAAVWLGRQGGLKGGPARAKALSAHRRRAIARKAGTARWGKLNRRPT